MTDERNDLGAGPVPPVVPGFSDLSLMATGGVFETWRAVQESVGREVLIRVPRGDAPVEVVGHAMRMARRLSAFSTDGLERIFTIEEWAERPYLVLEKVATRTLADLVTEFGALPEEKILRVARRVSSVLRTITAKEPIVLRSLKPQNLPVDGEGNVKVSDFSLAVIAGDPVDGPSIDGGNIIGTPQFFSPEQASGDLDIDMRADMYALGLVLYFLATRKTPFEGHDAYEVVDLQSKGTLEDPRALNKDVSDGLATFIARLTMKDRANRYADWDKVLEDIDRLEEKRALALPLPDGALSTVALTVPDRAPSSTRPAGAAPKGQNRAKTGGRKRSPAHPAPVNPYGSQEAGKAIQGDRSGGHKAALWLLLVLWLAWLANCRMGNPMHLPEKAAPAIEIAALDDLFASVTGRPAPSAPAPVATPAPQVVQPVERPKPVAPVASPVEETPAPVVAPAPAPAVAPKAPAVPPPPAWIDEVVAPLRKGDLEGARKAAMAAGQSEAGRVAALLGSVPSTDDVFASILLRHKGEVVPITYMGKERKITPVRLDGKTLVTRFQAPDGSEKVIPIQLAKISDEEKKRWLQNAETEMEHAAVTIEALKAGDRFTASLHAKRAGALAPFLTAALK